MASRSPEPVLMVLALQALVWWWPALLGLVLPVAVLRSQALRFLVALGMRQALRSEDDRSLNGF